jgi:hypothetical protein
VFHVEHFRDAQSNTLPLFALTALFVQIRMRRDFNLNKEASQNGQRGGILTVRLIASFAGLVVKNCSALTSVPRGTLL